MKRDSSRALAWLAQDTPDARAACEAGAAHVGASVRAWHTGTLAGALAQVHAQPVGWLVMPSPAPLGGDAAELESALLQRLRVRVAYADGSTSLSPERAAAAARVLVLLDEGRRRWHLATQPVRVGTAPYGWRRVRGRLVGDPYEQAVLGRIAQLRGRGLGCMRIAHELERLGYIGRHGKVSWHHSFVAALNRRQDAQPVRPAGMAARAER